MNTVCAIATPPGNGAIAMIRLSGRDAIAIVDKIFKGKKTLSKKESQSLSFGRIYAGDKLIDEVLVGVFRSPQSYTGENMVEISCHASSYIQQCIVELLLEAGAVLASPGEFTQRAYLNGKMDLSQAEAVADVIGAHSAASHKIAMQQMRGGYSELLKVLRADLLNFASLLELELDFSEEDVEFANRIELGRLAENLHTSIKKLADSFRLGNVLKKGVPIAIVGKPNVGKSTLLNVILGENKAIVSEVAGTTRDVIEDTVTIKGVEYRFIDTAGIRKTKDVVESIGIERTWQKIDLAEIVLLVVDATDSKEDNIAVLEELKNHIKGSHKMLLLLINKIDKGFEEEDNYSRLIGKEQIIPIAAKTKRNIDILENKLHDHYLSMQQYTSSVIVSNIRHYDLLRKAEDATARILVGLESGVSADFIAQDLREALNHLGSITGEISTDDILGSIFHNFCIGK